MGGKSVSKAKGDEVLVCRKFFEHENYFEYSTQTLLLFTIETFLPFTTFRTNQAKRLYFDIVDSKKPPLVLRYNVDNVKDLSINKALPTLKGLFDRENRYNWQYLNMRAPCFSSLFDDENILKEIDCDNNDMLYLSERLKNDKQFIIDMVSKNNQFLQHASHILKQDREVVMAAIKNDGLALRFADRSLLEDEQVLLTAISNCRQTFGYDNIFTNFITSKCKGNKKNTLDMMSYNGLALEFCKEFASDKEVVEKAVQNNGMALQYAAESFKDDKNIVLKAIT